MNDETNGVAVWIYLVQLPSYDTGDDIDSVWTSEDAALARAAELGKAFVTEYRANAVQRSVRGGWAPPSDPLVWSDWGGSR